MNRNDLMDVDIAVMDFLQAYPDAPMAKIIRAAVEAAEPLIREDERQRTPVVYERDLQPLADLRAKVAALRDEAAESDRLYGEDGSVDALNRVLALFNGSSE